MAKRLFPLPILLMTLIFFSTSSVFALEFPEPLGYVNDFANILSPDTRQALEQRLTQLEKDSSIEIAVVTVESLEGTTVEDYAVRLFEAWKIGKENKDNGVLFLIAPNEHQIRIEVGYGLEPILTDAKVGRLLDNYVAPAFAEGDYNKGVSEGVGAIVKLVQGEGVGVESSNGVVWIPLFVGAIFLSYLSSFLARSKRFWPGGVIGAILGLVLGIYLYSILLSILAALGLGILGLLFDYFLSKNYKERKERGLPTSFWQSGGGFFGSAGGGFGGFGGGRSGGGGASRSW